MDTGRIVETVLKLIDEVEVQAQHLCGRAWLVCEFGACPFARPGLLC
jgi:hypothetical protein